MLSNSSNNNITNGQNLFKNGCTILSITWSRLNINKTPTDCDNNPYTGTVCRDILTAWHLCTVKDGDIVIYSNESDETQVKHERDLLKLDSLLAIRQFSCVFITLSRLQESFLVRIFCCKAYYKCLHCSEKV